MRVFNCNPKWPLCLFDFTFKHKIPDFIILTVSNNLHKYVIDDYFGIDDLDQF